MACHLRFAKNNLAMQAVVLSAVLFACLPGFKAQEYKVVYKQIPDNRGTEFVVGFMQQFSQELDGATRLFITSDYNTQATITSEHANVKKTIEIKARELYPVDFPTSIRMKGSKIEKKAIHIKAESEIVVYGLNIKKYTTDAYLALPVDIQSTKYILPSFTPSYRSLIGIMSIYDRTTIFVTFRFADRKTAFVYRGRSYRHKDTLSLTLLKFQTFQVAHSSDMSGTRIFSTKPISVLSGNECANVPTDKGYCDHLVEHIPPVNTWGQRFITAPLEGRRGGDFFRIMAANQSTDVRINGKYIKTLDEGKFIELDVPSDRYQYIQTSKPCIVIQFSKGQKVDNTFTDPFMVMIPPVEQYTAQYTVSTPDQSKQYFKSYINIIINTKEIDGLRLDGRSLRDEKWVPVWGTTHSAARIPVTHGVHRVIHDSPIVPFAIFLYGYARADSYGYPGGLRLADLTLECVPGNPGDGLDNDCDRRIDEEIKNYIDDDNDGRIDEDLVTDPPEIILDLNTVILNGCPAEVKKKLKEPKVISAPLCSGRGPIKLSFVDEIYEKNCVQYIERMWLVKDGCGNLANTTQQIRIKRPEMSVTFPDDVRGKCHLGEDMSEVGEPRVRMSCKDDEFSVKYRDTPSLVECIRRGRTIAREWTVKASCGSVIKHTQKLLPDVTPPKINFVGKLQYLVKRDFRISWNASEESTFECALDNPNTPIPCGRGWGESWSKRDIPDGKHMFWVRATDLAGNTGAYIKHPFQVDNSGPRLQFERPLKELSRFPMPIKWKSNEMSRFKCGMNPDRMEQCGSGTEGKDYRRDLQDGTYTFYVGAVDKGGNQANMIKHTFRIDSTPPRIKFGSSSQPSLNSEINLPILSNELADFTCSLDDQPYTNCGRDSKKGRFIARNLAEGPHELKVKAVDEAGNEAEPISLKWNSDKTSPNIIFKTGLPTKFRENAKAIWTSTEYANFECSLNDDTRFTPCGRGITGQWTKNRVPEGYHDLFVRGTDRNGNVGPVSSFRFSIDNKYPIVSLREPLPRRSTSETATFRWRSNEMAYYKCAVDDPKNFVDCGSGLTGDWTTSRLSNGKHTFYLLAKDEVGNTAPQLSHSWSIDNTAPVLKFTGDLPDNINNNKQRFTWSSSEYARFNCYIDTEDQPIKCGSGRRGSWTSNELADGQHTFRVRGTDEYGNEGSVIQHTWDIDTKAPTVNLGKVPKTLNKSKAQFNWKSNEPSRFRCALDDNEVGEECGEGRDGEYLTPTLVDGEHEFRLLVEDMVGNLAPLIRSKFTIDTSLPVITFDKPDPKKPEKDLSVTWKSSEDADFECALDSPFDYKKCGNGKTGAFQKDDLPDGEHKLYVRGKDDVGNVGKPSVYTVTTDRTPPTVRFTDKYNALSKNPTETFTWSSDEPATFKCKVDERREVDCGQGSDGSFRIPNLPDGEHVFQVTPFDKAGNKGKMLERKWVKDSTPPYVRYASQPPEVSKDTVVFKWISTETASFECALDDKSKASRCGSGTTGEKRLTNLPKGTRVFYVRGTDNAGNVGQFVSHYWTVDTNPPIVEFTGDLPSFSKKSIRFSWKSTEDSKFECALDDETKFEPCGEGLTGKRRLLNLPEGTHTFYVRARDKLDNVNDDPISHSWTVDSIPPNPIVDPVNPIVGTPRVTLSWKTDERSRFFCAIGDVGNVIDCGQGTTGSWTTPYLRRGPQSFWLIAEDFNGNRAEPVKVNWNVDNKAPVVTFSKDSTDKSTTSSPRFSWTSDEKATFECAIQGVTDFEDCGSGTSGTWTGRNVPDGKRTFLVRARDPFGNQNDPYSFPFEVDTTPPTGFATSGPPKRTNKPRATFRWRTNEDSNYDCYLDNQADPTVCGSGTNGEFTTSSLPDGEHEFSIVATDSHGNKAPVVNSKWTIDTSGPKLTFSSNLPKYTLSSPWFNWTSDETADRFLCSLDDQSTWEYCGSGKTGAWQRFNVPDGNHKLYVQGTDDLGNKGPIISHPFVVDNTAPRISITTPPNPSSSKPVIEWKSTEPVDFTCTYDDGQSFDCGKERRTGSWVLTNVPDGPRKFVIEGKDKVGNTGRFTYTWRKDSTAPAVTFDKNQPTVTLRTPRFTWTSSENAVFECSLDDFRTMEPCGSGSTGSWQRYKPDGDYELSVRAKDNNGNTGVPAKHRFTVDNTVPIIALTSSNDLATSTPTFKWTASEDVNFRCSYDDGTFFNCGNGTTGSWTLNNVPDGEHNFVIEGKDKIGNTGRHTFNWNKDSSGPQITFDQNQPTVTLRYPRFSWTSSEPASFECSTDGFVNNIEQCGSGTSGSWQRSKPDGKYTFSVRGRDRNRNTGSPVTHSFRVDNTPPKIKIDTRPENNSPKPFIQWSSDEDVKFRCSLDYGEYFDCGSGTTGSWTGNNIIDGPHSFAIEGKDEVDNTGRHTYSWTQDSVPPSVQFRNIPDKADVSPRFTFTSDEPVIFQCSLDGENYVNCGQGYDGQWQKSRIPGGEHKFSVRARDRFGNIGKPVTHTWTIDSKGPQITLGDKRVSQNRALFSWTSDKPARFYCALDNQNAWQPCGAGTSGSRPFYNLPDGSHTFYVRGEDARRNMGNTVSHRFDIDSTPPNVNITSDDSPYSTRSPSFTFTSSEDATFKCAIDDTRFYTPCGKGLSGQFTASNVLDGRHAFFVQGTDDAGNVGEHKQYVFVVDTTSPRGYLTSNVPRTTKNPRVRLTWSANEHATFKCTVDGKTTDCGSGTQGEFTTDPLSDGRHTFSLNLVDKVGNKGEPVTVSWETDSQSPVINFDPNLPTRTSGNPKVQWTSSEFAYFECDLDGLQTIVCGQGTSGDMTFGVSKGPHTFSVRGTDRYRNVGEWKRYKFNVDTDGPVITFPTDQPKLTKSNPSFTWTSSESATFKCGIDNSFNLQDCGEGIKGQWTKTNIPDGQHVFIVIGTDDLGNQGPYAQHRFTVDNSVPVVVFQTSNKPTNANPQIRWTSSENAQFQCSVNGQDYKDCGSGFAGVWTGNDLPDGEHIFKVKAKDDNGNVGESTFKWSVDNQGPDVSITSNIPSENNSPRQRITWSSSEPATVECRLNGQLVSCGGGTNGQYTTPNLPDGKYTFEINSVDNLGNKGTRKVVKWTTDRQPPNLFLTSKNPPKTSNPKYTLTWNTNEQANFKCTLNSRIVDCGDGTSGKYTTPNLPDGRNTFEVHAVDTVGNKGRPRIVTWVTDSKPPELTITSNNPSETNNPRQTITWISNEPVDSFECTLDGRKVDCGSGTNGVYTTPDLPDGKHTFSLNAVDDLGNRGTAKFVSWTTDKRGPGLTITSNNPPSTKDKKQTITWSSSETAKFECKLNGRVVSCGSGTNGQYTTPNLPDGQNTFEVNAVDDLGNKGTRQVVSWSTDTQGPRVQITNSIPSETSDPQTRITWSSSEPGTFECLLDGVKVPCGDGTTGDYTTPDLTDGKHWFSVQAVDPLGNKGEAVRVEWETDSTPPDISFSSTLPDKTKGTPQITWTSSEPVGLFECALDVQGRKIRCGRGTSGEWNGLNIPHGPHTFWVRGTDSRGNVGEWEPYVFEVDSQGPNVIFNDQPTTTKNSPTFTWNSSEPAKFKCRMEDSFKEFDCGDGTNGRWTMNEIPDGPHQFFVYGVDEMDNKGELAKLDFHVDGTGPKITFPAEQPKITKSNPTFTWKSSEPAVFKCVIDNDGQLNFFDCGNGTNGQWTGNNLPDGPFKFLVYGTDYMNNRGPTKEHTFSVDNSGPAIKFNSADNVTDGSPQFTWTSKEDAEFLCSLDGAKYEDCGRGKSGVWNGRNIPHGKHVLYVKGKDTNGNVGEPARQYFTADTRPPNVRIEPLAPKTSRDAITIKWTSDERANYLCSIDNSPATDCDFGIDGEWTTPRLNDGIHTFSLTAKDLVNNIAPTLTTSWTTDTTGPKISFAPNQPKRVKTSPTFKWTSSEPAKFKCALDNGQFNFFECGEGTSGQWTGENVPDGSYRLLVYGTDDVNNRGPTAEHTFIVDKTPPEITFSGNLPETTTKNPTLTWSSSEFATFECKLEDGTIFNCGSGDDGAWTGNNLSDGPHSLSVRGIDRLGNRGQFISRSWNVDESGPRLSFVGDIPSRARVFPRIRWVSNEYALFECSLNGGKFTRCGSGLQGSWSRSEISTGSHEFRVRGRDTKGNVGEIITTTIEIDTTAPVINLREPLPDKTEQPTWSFTWTSSEIANFTCAVNSLRNPVHCGSGTSGRFTTGPLPDGRHTFYLLGEDALGNAARVVTHKWVVDKIEPEVEFIPNQPEISDADTTFLWKTISNKPAEFECALDDVNKMQPCGKGARGSWTGSDIPDGDHTLYVRAKDSFGDYGKTKTHKWKVDTKVPNVRLIGTPPRRSTYDTGTFYWTSDEDASYECAIDLAESGTPCGSGVRQSWISSKLKDGHHSFYLFATDSNGNQGNPVEYKWEIDTKPPVVTFDENTPRVSGHNVTLKWRSNENAIFQCAVDSIFDNRDCGSGRANEIKLTDLADGPHDIWIKAVDMLGNIAPWTKHSWIVDSKPPVLDFTSELPDRTNGDVSFFWTSKEPAKFKCGTDSENLQDCGDGKSGNWSAKNLPDGEHEFFVEATDEFGNKIRIVHKWTVDNTPPLLSWRKKPAAVTGKRVKFRWKSNEIADFYCAHEKINDLKRCGNASLKGNWIEENLPEGKHLFWVLGVDDVGNRGKPLAHEWVVDTKGPRLYFNQPVPKKSGSGVRFSWRSSENAKFECALDNREVFFKCGEGFEAQLRFDNLKRNGEHVLHVRGTDDQNNVGDIISAEWTVDLVAPVLIDVGPLPRLTNPNPVFTWTVNEEAVFECAIDDLENYKWCGNGTKGKWQGKDLNPGDYEFILRVKDPQGNTNNLIRHKFVVGIPDNRGREFMLAFMQQYLEKKSGSVRLFITSDNDTVATVSIPGVKTFHQEIPIQSDELIRVDLPIGVRMSGTQKEKKGILVTAEHELVVYGLNIMPHSTDAYLALPTDIQGTEYYAVSFTVSQHSLIGIVGIYDKTVIYITLKMSKDVPLVYEGAAYRNGDTMIIEMDRQDTFQLTHTEDLTGTHIASTNVISVYSGNECANVPKEHGYCDHLVEMLTPTSTWGRRFVTAPLFSRKSGDFFRIVASKDDTSVTFHPSDQVYLKAGQYIQRDVPSDEYKFITATKPCLLMQYSKGADTDDTDTDPFAIMIPPIEQYASHYILSTPDRRRQYFQSYINIIVLSQHIQGVLIDGKPVYPRQRFKQIPGTPYSAAAVKVTKGVHRVDHQSPIVTFGAFMYGYAWRDSYGYPGGLRLADITGICTAVDTPADGMDNDCDRRIDEELKNGIDDDGDGRIDEDLATFPPSLELDTPYYEYDSCVFTVDALVPQPKAISSAECNFKGALRLTYSDRVVVQDCVHLVNRTWKASDGCGNVVYLNQIIKITRPKLVVRFPNHVPNGCVGSVSLRETGRPEVKSPCKQERVRVAYRDNISKKDCQEKGLLLERHFTVTEVCGREYTGVQRIYPGARN